MRKIFAIAVLSAVTAGCTSPASHIVTGKVRKATEAQNVVILTEKPSNYSEIAVLATSHEHLAYRNNETIAEDVEYYLRKEAASLGANAVILSKVNKELVNKKGTSYDGQQGGVHNIDKWQTTAVALAVYIDE